MNLVKDVIKGCWATPPSHWHPPGTQEMLALLERDVDVNSAPLSPIVTIS